MTTPNEKGDPIAEPPSTITNKNYNKAGINPLPPTWLSEPIPEPEYLIQDILVKGHLTMLTGRPKAGKSTLLRHLAVSLAQGKPALKKYAVKQSPVLYLALEENSNDVKRAFKKLGLQETDPLYIHFGNPGEFKSAITSIEEFVEEKDIGLVIIDTAMRLRERNFDTNSYSDVMEWTTPFLHLSQGNLNVCIVMAYHDRKTTKGGKNYEALDDVNGSTALTASMDSILHLRRDWSGVREVFSNSRIVQQLEPAIVKMNPVTGDLEYGGASDEPAPAIDELALLRAKEKVREHLKNADLPILQAKLKEEVGGEGAVTLAAINALVEDNEFGRTGKGKAGDPFKINR